MQCLTLSPLMERDSENPLQGWGMLDRRLQLRKRKKRCYIGELVQLREIRFKEERERETTNVR